MIDFVYGFLHSLLEKHFYVDSVCVHGRWFVVGFISDLIKKLWGELEIADDSPVYTPKYWPINPIDKAAKKVCDVFLMFSAKYYFLRKK